MTTMVITEKPSVALDIARILGGFDKREGYLEGKNTIITWALGHLIELAMPQEYDPALEKWDIHTLPILPEQFKLIPKVATKKQLNTIKKLLNRSDVERLINACDAGREGELIFRQTIQYLECRKPYDRLWLSETTPEAVRDAFSNLRSSSEVDNLAKAAIVRSQADWIVGLNATRAYTCQYGEKMTVGRVQTPTLALIVNRERQIKGFIPEPYHEVIATFSTHDGSYTGKWFRDKQDRFSNRLEPEAITNRLSLGMDGIITHLEQKEIQELPPHLYNLNDLQKDANKKFGLTAEQTLTIAQKLYESKLITYPRTDSRYLTRSMAATLPERLNALKKTELDSFLSSIKTDLDLADKRWVDDTKVNDHTAIIITSVSPNLSVLNEKECQVYTLVARRMLGIFLPAAKYMQTMLVTVIAGEQFQTKGRIIVDEGWRILLSSFDGEDETDIFCLPILQQGETATLTEIIIEDKKTHPPKRYTEADLLSAMENAGRVIENESLRKAIQGKGLGTAATRASVIEKLIDVGYITRQKKILLPTDKGQRLIDYVVPQLKDPEMTAEWEQRLLDIEQGKYDSKFFLDEIKSYTKGVIEELKTREPVKAPDLKQKSLGKCPLCGQSVVEGKKGYGCSAWKEGCKFVIWKEIAGKKITMRQAQNLLEKGKTDLIKGFKSKKGNSFDAYLVLNDGKVSFSFPSKSGYERRKVK